MSDNIRKAAGHLRAWPSAYRMGEHDTNVCIVAANGLDALEAKDQRIAELEAVVDTGIRCMEQRNVAYERIAELEQALLRIEELSPSGLHKNSVFTPNWYDTFRRAQAIAEDTRKEDKP